MHRSDVPERMIFDIQKLCHLEMRELIHHNANKQWYDLNCQEPKKQSNVKIKADFQEHQEYQPEDRKGNTKPIDLSLATDRVFESAIKLIKFFSREPFINATYVERWVARTKRRDLESVMDCMRSRILYFKPYHAQPIYFQRRS